MICTILNKLKIGNNLSISIDGNCENLKNGDIIEDEFKNTFQIISVGMTRFGNTEDLFKSTDLLIKGSVDKIGNKVII